MAAVCILLIVSILSETKQKRVDLVDKVHAGNLGYLLLTHRAHPLGWRRRSGERPVYQHASELSGGSSDACYSIISINEISNIKLQRNTKVLLHAPVEARAVLALECNNLATSPMHRHTPTVLAGHTEHLYTAQPQTTQGRTTDSRTSPGMHRISTVTVDDHTVVSSCEFSKGKLENTLTVLRSARRVRASVTATDTGTASYIPLEPAMVVEELQRKTFREIKQEQGSGVVQGSCDSGVI